ncbi:MAG: hypothetical protein U1E65_34890 [Myxococcota bacterium]
MNHPIARAILDRLSKADGRYSEAALAELEPIFRHAADDAVAVEAGFTAIGMVEAVGFSEAAGQLRQLVLKLIIEGQRPKDAGRTALGRFEGRPKLRPDLLAPPPAGTVKASSLSGPPRALRG